ncbi:MAG: ATP-binding protein [Verrucomicrobia bacterium]|nr:ATP-binding protein [Verrucomicrobiota bacterium]
MSSHLSVSETIDLLDRLKTAIRTAAAAEEKLEHDYRLQSGAAAKSLEQSAETNAARRADDLQRAEAAWKDTRARLQARYERRLARFQQARQSSQHHLAERIDHEEGRRKYAAQKGLIETERERKENLARNDETLAEFSRQLAENREAFVALEAATAHAFRGYPPFVARLTAPPAPPPPDPAADEYQLLETLHDRHAKADADLGRFERFLFARMFRDLALGFWILLIVVGCGVAVPVLRYFGSHHLTYPHAAALMGALLALLLALYFYGRRQAGPLAASLAQDLESARQLHNAALEKAQARHAREIERIQAEAQNRARQLEQDWQTAVEQSAAVRESAPARLEARARRVADKLERWHQARRRQLERDQAAARTRLDRETAAQQQQLNATHAARRRQLDAEHQARWAELQADWTRRLGPVYDALRRSAAAAAAAFPPWEPERWDLWTPPAAFHNAAPFGSLEVDVSQLAETLPKDARLALPGPARFTAPLVLVYPQRGSILFETTRSGGETAVAALNNIVFRLLAVSPPGKVSFTIIDPLKLGQNFAGIMHLADFEDNLINNRIWTQTAQIEQRLADLNEHMEKVIQMYLRNEYATIAEYNAQAGNIAEKHHFVVIADFPVNFSETATRRLLHIAASGARCGVYTLIHWDHRHPAPPDFVPDDLRKSSVCIQCSANQLLLANPPVPGTRVLPEAPPEPALATGFLQKVGQSSRGANRVEVPFSQVAPADPEMWTLETTEELRVPIGRSGATKLQYLAIGKGTRQHALVAGKTGSGKSTLFHVIITNLALWCSPEQVEFYLVDFKKGVEFKGYAARRLPQARVVAIESDREFGLSVLQRVDEELKRRGDLFRQLGVQDLPGYKRAGGNAPMPRSLLIIDEFQEFFVEDDRISQAAAVLLDRIVRQGRAFGIHVLLGSQTLGGAYTLARTTLGQMVIRIALQCNEADAYLIMDENNAAPRLLSRPGEGIYNDMAGMQEGNSPFQAVWLSDADRDACLQRVRTRADGVPTPYPGPIVFEGNAPADVRENQPLQTLLGASRIQPAPAARIWLGAPNSIKGPTEALFQKRSGSHLLLVGQRDEAILAIFTLGLVALAAQYPASTVRFVLLESLAPGSPGRAWIDRVVGAIPHDLTLAKAGALGAVMTSLTQDLDRRAEDESRAAPAVFLFIHGLQHFKKLRQDEDMGFSLDDTATQAKPAAQLLKLVNEGAAHGIHVVAAVDTYNNVNRFLGRKALNEFEMRVLFQMSANDSASLCDDPKASALGLHRALFFNEQEGTLETFRPYALPPAEWLDHARTHLDRLARCAPRPRAS